MFYISLFCKFLKIRWKAQLSYPIPFVIGIIAQWTNYGASFLSIWIMIQTFGSMATWTPMEVLFLNGVNTLSYALAASLMLSCVNTLPELARTGDFDSILLKPINSLFFSMASNVNIGYIAHVTLSVAIIGICISSLEIIMTVPKTIWLVVTIISATTIHMAAMIITTAPSLIFLGNKGLGILYWDVEEFLHYPLSVYGKPLQFLLTFILPYAFIAFYPSQVILCKNDTLFFSSYIQYGAPVVGFLLLMLAIGVWKLCTKHYESTGS